MSCQSDRPVLPAWPSGGTVETRPTGRSILMKSLIAAFGIGLTVMLSAPAGAQPPAPVDCEAERCRPEVQTAVQNCGCDTATNHGTYVSCVASAVNDLAENGTIDRKCKGRIKRCA